MFSQCRRFPTNPRTQLILWRFRAFLLLLVWTKMTLKTDLTCGITWRWFLTSKMSHFGLVLVPFGSPPSDRNLSKIERKAKSMFDWERAIAKLCKLCTRYYVCYEKNGPRPTARNCNKPQLQENERVWAGGRDKCLTEYVSGTCNQMLFTSLCPWGQNEHV